MKTKDMKYILFGAILSTLLLSACSNELRVELDIPDADKYVSIYMPQANNSPNVKSVYITDEVQSFPVTAYYGGPKTPGQDVKVEFETRLDLVDEYNASHGTNYQPMPEGSYSMKQTVAYIKSGMQCTDPINVDIISKDYLTVPQSYLLPVGIKQISGQEPIVSSLQVAYFLITGSYLPGQVPCEKVYSFGHEVTKPIFCRNQDLIRIDESDNLQLYQLKEDGTYSDPRQIGQGWGGIDIIFYMPDDRFIIRNPWSNLTQYSIDDNYNFGSQRDIGWGWGGAKMIFPFKDLALIAVNGDNITKYPLSQSGDFDFANCSDIEPTGWGNYTQVFGYNNNLIAIESNGNLWVVPMTDSYATSTRRKAGTGWNMYVKVFQCGNDLLALDKNGDLWRYKFDPSAFWPLKAESSESAN